MVRVSGKENEEICTVAFGFKHSYSLSFQGMLDIARRTYTETVQDVTGSLRQCCRSVVGLMICS